MNFSDVRLVSLRMRKLSSLHYAGFVTMVIGLVGGFLLDGPMDLSESIGTINISLLGIGMIITANRS